MTTTLESRMLSDKKELPPSSSIGAGGQSSQHGWFSIRCAKFGNMVVALTLVAFPLAIFSVSLVFLVLERRVRHTPPSAPSLSFQCEEDEPGVFYVRIGSTTLVLLGSFSSSIAPVLVGFAMTLLSYSVAQRMLYLSNAERLQDLPTPYQIVLLIKMLDGSFGVLWKWLKYILQWRTANVINTSGWALLMSYALVYTPQLL